MKLPPAVRDVIRDGLAAPRGSRVENSRPPQIMSSADVRRASTPRRRSTGGASGAATSTGSCSRLPRPAPGSAKLRESASMGSSPLRRGYGSDERQRPGQEGRLDRGSIGPDVVAALEPCTAAGRAMSRCSRGPIGAARPRARLRQARGL